MQRALPRPGGCYTVVRSPALLEHGLADQLNFVLNLVMVGGGTTLSARQAHEPAPGLGHRAPQRRGRLVLRKCLKDGGR